MRTRVGQLASGSCSRRNRANASGVLSVEGGLRQRCERRRSRRSPRARRRTGCASWRAQDGPAPGGESPDVALVAGDGRHCDEAGCGEGVGGGRGRCRGRRGQEGVEPRAKLVAGLCCGSPATVEGLRGSGVGQRGKLRGRGATGSSRGGRHTERGGGSYLECACGRVVSAQEFTLEALLPGLGDEVPVVLRVRGGAGRAAEVDGGPPCGVAREEAVHGGWVCGCVGARRKSSTREPGERRRTPT